jgi:hypothetical protein
MMMVDKMWSKITSSIKRVAREVLEESKGYEQMIKETWWNKEVQATIRLKRELNLRLIINYIAIEGQMMEKIIFINLLRQGK